ncbi:MAG: type II secretion system minor pseudopilin GspK [Desulfuromonadaceae bacterium]|nr:type II secretion system minor pseudopilin GspK [Desulfuromonadaceae bacterium]
MTGVVHNERGMVLLLVLLIVALLTALVIDFSASTLVDLRLAETHRDSTQAYYLAKGGINVGRMLLQEDRNNFDARSEMWGQGLDEYPVDDNAAITIKIDDLDGRIACNRLMMTNNNIDVELKQRLQRLFQRVLEISADEALELVNNLRDWLDPDDDGDAESNYYLRLEPPYRAKNGALDTFNELVMVKGFDAQRVARLEPHLSAFGGPGTNINTASAEVIQALAEEIDQAAAEAIIDYRTSTPIKAIKELEGVAGLNDAYPALSTKATALTAPLIVKSEHYRIRTAAYVNEGTRRLEALVTKTGNQLHYLKIL